MMNLALNYPEKVDKLVLISPGLNGWNYFQDTIPAQNYLARQQAIANNDTLEAARLFHQNWVAHPRHSATDLSSKVSADALTLINHSYQNHWQSDWSKLDTIQAINRLPDINIETLILKGEDDAEDIHLICDILNDQIKNSSHQAISNAAHSINMEYSKIFNQIIGDFIAIDP